MAPESLAHVDATIDAILRDPAASHWLKAAVASAKQRDPVDACYDAEALYGLLKRRADAILNRVARDPGHDSYADRHCGEEHPDHGGPQ